MMDKDFDVEAHDRRIRQERAARVKADPIGRAVALFSEIIDSSWQDEFCDCLRLADPEVLKAALLAKNARDWAEFDAHMELWRKSPEQPEQKRIDQLAKLSGCPPYVIVTRWLEEQGLISRPGGFAGEIVFSQKAEKLLATSNA